MEFTIGQNEVEKKSPLKPRIESEVEYQKPRI